MTFFSKSGAKTRSLINFVVNSTAKNDQSGGVANSLDKLAVAMKFFNHFTKGAPLISRHDFNNHELVRLFTKYKVACWPGSSNVAEYISEDEDGQVVLRSTDEDGVASIAVSADGFSVHVSYLHLLENKAPEWVEVDPEASIDSKSNRRLRMSYQYLRIHQVFCIGDVPDSWLYPLHLLLQVKETD